jgi:hypothetical protein
MRLPLALLLPLALAACSGGDDTDGTDDTDSSDTTDTTDGSGQNENPLTIEAAGDFACFTPAADYASSTWLTQQVNAALVGSALSVSGVTKDFEDEVPVDNTEVRLWFGDDTSVAEDIFQTVDDDGSLTFEAPACQPLAYLTNPVPGLEDAKATYKAHQVYGYSEAGAAEAEFISVSRDSFNVIQAIVGLTPDPTKSVIAGTAFDCTRQPDTLSDVDDGKVEGVQITVTDTDGNPIEGVVVRYFIENFPDRDQPHTSADGLFLATNVPPGEIRVEMRGLVGGEEKLLGAALLRSNADSINIANVFAGFDSVKYPESCLE